MSRLLYNLIFVVWLVGCLQPSLRQPNTKFKKSTKREQKQDELEISVAKAFWEGFVQMTYIDTLSYYLPLCLDETDSCKAKIFIYQPNWWQKRRTAYLGKNAGHKFNYVYNNLESKPRYPVEQPHPRQEIENGYDYHLVFDSINITLDSVYMAFKMLAEDGQSFWEHDPYGRALYPPRIDYPQVAVRVWISKTETDEWVVERYALEGLAPYEPKEYLRYAPRLYPRPFPPGGRCHGQPQDSTQQIQQLDKDVSGNSQDSLGRKSKPLQQQGVKQ